MGLALPLPSGYFSYGCKNVNIFSLDHFLVNFKIINLYPIRSLNQRFSMLAESTRALARNARCVWAFKKRILSKKFLVWQYLSTYVAKEK